MDYLLTGAWLVLYWAWWGLGFCLLAVPGRWTGLVGALTPAMGLSLQIATGWWCLQLGLRIGELHPWIESVPAVLLGFGLWRQRGVLRLRRHLRSPHFYWVTLFVVLALVRAAWPSIGFEEGPKHLTTYTVGSCDGPDYAMGVRLFREPGLSETGYFAQPEVHQLPEEMTIWQYWTRINHFGPAAAIGFAMNVTGLPVWKLITVFGAAISAAAVPLVWAISQRVFRLNALLSTAALILYICSPLWPYAVYHSALGQLMGTLGVTAVFLGGLTAIREKRSWGSWLRVLPLGIAMYWLVFSSYFVASPLPIAVLGLSAVLFSWIRRSVGPLVSFFGWVAIPAAAALLLFPQRMVGFIESLYFFRDPFGWTIGPMDPLALVGLPFTGHLESRPPVEYIAIFVGFAICASALGIYWLRRLPLAACGWVALLAVWCLGTGMLYYRDPTDANLTSYKAYKLAATLSPLLLAAIPGLFRPLARWRRLSPVLLAIAAGFFLYQASNSMRQLYRQATFPGNTAPRCLDALAAIEKDPQYKSFNIVARQLWVRLWCSAMLAQKPQFFSKNTYVGRGPTDLQGEWTIGDALTPKPAGVPVQDLGDGIWLAPAP